MAKKLTERALVRKFRSRLKHAGKKRYREVPNTFGQADVVDETHVWEAKLSLASFKEAVGQCLAYAHALKKKPGIVMGCVLDETHLELCRSLGISVVHLVDGCLTDALSL